MYLSIPLPARHLSTSRSSPTTMSLPNPTSPSSTSNSNSNSTSTNTNTATRKLHAHETPSQLAKTGYDAHARTYLEWTISQPNPSRLHYLQQTLDLLSSRSRPQSQSQSRDQNPSCSLSTSPSQVTGSADSRVTVLELGCGAGAPVTLSLARNMEAVRRVVATDISRTQLGLLGEGLRGLDDDDGSMKDRVEMVESDMLNLGFEEAGFDVVVAFFILIHLARGDQVVMMRRRVWGWLGEGGCLCANFGVLETDEGEEDVVLGQGVSGEEGSTIKTGCVREGWLGMDAYWDGYGVERTKAILKDVGFEIVVADVVEEVGDANFLWIIARKS